MLTWGTLEDPLGFWVSPLRRTDDLREDKSHEGAPRDRVEESPDMAPDLLPKCAEGSRTMSAAATRLWVTK